MLQHAVGQLLESRGWSVTAEGRLLVGAKGDSEILLAFLTARDVSGFLGRAEETSATVGAVLLDAVPGTEVVRLEEVGVVCFDREDAEDAVLADLMHRQTRRGSAFLEFLENA